MLIYESHTYRESGEPEDTRGFCCARCAVELVKKLESAESQQWTEEEAALQADDLEISDFRRHRLAALQKMDGS